MDRVTPATMAATQSSPRKRRPRRLLAAAASALLLGGCGSGNSSGNTPTTETVTGVLDANSFSMEPVVADGDGTLLVTLTSLSPQSTITVGLGLGVPSGGTCGLLSYTDAAKVGSSSSLPVTSGTWCWTLIDTGSVQGFDNYTVSVTHP